MAMSAAELSKIRQRQVLEANVEAVKATRQREERTRRRKKMNREGVRFMAGAGVVVACLFIAVTIAKVLSISIAGPEGFARIVLFGLAFGCVGAVAYKYLREDEFARGDKRRWESELCGCAGDVSGCRIHAALAAGAPTFGLLREVVQEVRQSKAARERFPSIGQDQVLLPRQRVLGIGRALFRRRCVVESSEAVHLADIEARQDRNGASDACNDNDNFFSKGQVKHILPEKESEREENQTHRNNVGPLEQQIAHGYLPGLLNT
jgi:hypothetical protein